MNTFVISDVHLGSYYCLHASFIRFLEDLPPGATLLLNGDIVDRWHGELVGEHRRALGLLLEQSRQRSVVWVRGNHDEQFSVADPVNVEFTSSYSLGKRLYISHGYDFDNVMPRHCTFIKLFRALHFLRVRLGAEAVHVAHYAKRFQLLYNVLQKHVRDNAIEYAIENGYEAVTCGHTHYPEDSIYEGVRYINTGSWTEKEIVYLHVTDTDMRLVRESAPSQDNA